MHKLDYSKLILDFNRNPEVRHLTDYYESPSFLELLSVSRREMTHSAFLAALLREDGFHGMGSLPLMLLLDKLIERVDKQDEKRRLAQIAETDAFFPALRRAVLARTLSPFDIRTDTEVDFDDGNGDSGRVDLEIKCQTSPLHRGGKNKNVKNLTIVIENKVSATEIDSQTERYYHHYESLLANNSILEHPRSHYNLYVYLSPASEQDMETVLMPCKCERFICINYQDILDGVIEPLLERSELSRRARFILEEYRRSLSVSLLDVITSGEKGKAGVKTIIMAIENERASELLKFWRDNKFLLKAAIDEKNRKADEKGLPQDKRSYYTWNSGEDDYCMSRLVQAIIANYAETHTFDQILDVFGIRKRSGKNDIIAPCDKADDNYYFTDQVIRTSDEVDSYAYKLWDDKSFSAFKDRALECGFMVRDYHPQTISKEDSELLCEFYDHHEKLIIAALEAIRIRTPWDNGDIDDLDSDLRDEVETMLKRISRRRSRRTKRD